MTPEQALMILKQVMAMKPGLSVDDCAAVVQAWNVLAELVKPKEPEKK